MPATTSERLRLLREHHVPHLTSGQERCLGYLVFGYSNSEAGAELEIAPSTFRRHIGEASHRVFDPIGLMASRETPGHLVLAPHRGLHSLCPGDD